MNLDFFSITHHGMGTLLAVIKESAAIVSKKMAGPLNEKQEYFLQMAERNIDKLTNLVHNVFTFQKLASGNMKFNMEENDLSGIVKDVQKTMGALAEQKGLSFSVRLDADLPRMVFDRGLISMAITNITGNAVNFTEKGSIGITAGYKDGTVRVSIKDTGCGIKKQDLPVLFHDFGHRKTGTFAKTNELALGLAISAKIIEAHGGGIRAESEPGRGTTISFTLPVNMA